MEDKVIIDELIKRLREKVGSYAVTIVDLETLLEIEKTKVTELESKIYDLESKLYDLEPGTKGK